MRKIFPVLLLLLIAVVTLQAQNNGTTKVAPTEISADLGTCSALITVTGTDAKPVYNAKVTTRIRYGTFGVKKLDLETYTSAGGQVKIANLPEALKKPVYIYISKEGKLATVEFKPEERCRAEFNVILK